LNQTDKKKSNKIIVDRVLVLLRVRTQKLVEGDAGLRGLLTRWLVQVSCSKQVQTKYVIGGFLYRGFFGLPWTDDGSFAFGLFLFFRIFVYEGLHICCLSGRFVIVPGIDECKLWLIF
jgi:hypothetical protein